MARRKPKSEPFRTIDLTATVRPPRPDPHYRATQKEMCELFDVSERTLRTWHDIGLPRETDARGRSVYPFPAANIWGMCYRSKVVASANRKGPRHLTVEDAYEWHLDRQHREAETDFVLVPVYWDHPMREEMLRKAAAGIEPDPVDE